MEDADHILFNCPFVELIRKRIFTWCRINQNGINNSRDLLQFVASWGRCPKLRKRLIVIGCGMLWMNSKCRNERLFQGALLSTSSIVDKIKSLSYHWLKCREKYDVGSWLSWNSSPLSPL
uniref:Reverse transcriptase zinc-binding domain-containing protein n=1 Tax=Lactuca sativa TaxID=4236 RepID=A0A9R1VKG9_LACSA|nr:hypothetical protein LSAT_V11C500297080 [Lactuca sativa]